MSIVGNIISIIFWGVVLLAVVVVIHEAGHFLAAKAFGVRVIEFMVGLPGPSVGFKWRGTRFGATAIPLGGYARIAGMETGEENPYLASAACYLYGCGNLTVTQAEEAGDELGYDLVEALDILWEWGSCERRKQRVAADAGKTYVYYAPETDSHALGAPRELFDPDAFIDGERVHTYRALCTWKRLLILAAGPLFNLIFALLTVAILLSSVGGYEVSLDVAQVPDGMPAAAAGMEPGDIITGIDGTAVDNYTEFYVRISEHVPGDTVRITYERDGMSRECALTLAENEGKPVIGVSLGYREIDISFWQGLGRSVSYIRITCEYILKLFSPAEVGQVLDNSTSVVGIAHEAKAAADSGFFSFIYLMAIISISLGLMNLLPIPPLDGGRIVVEAIERIVRRRIPPRVINYITLIGIVLMLILFVYLTKNDIVNYIIK